jgi:hypothetical protein
MNANKDAYRKEQGKFLNRLADNQHMQAAGKNLPGAAEFALDVMTVGEAALALKAVKPLLKAGAKYITEKTPLRNAYKFNPSALTDDILFNKKGVVNRQMFGDDAYNSFLKSGPTTRPNVSEYDQMMEFIKAPRSQVRSANDEVFEVAKTMEDGAFKYPYFQEGNLWYTGQQRNNLANQIGKERIITTPKSDTWFAPAGEGTVMGGDDLSKGLIDSYSKGRRVLMPGSEYANPSKYSVFEPHWWKGYKQLQEDGGVVNMKNGGYVVTRSSDRKGKTHKVTGPDGTVKYFGDSKLGQHPKDEKRKKAFYARHKSNLAGNPYFRAFARKTWEDGGQTDDDREMLSGVADILRRINDTRNRKEVANHMMDNFRDEDVSFEPNAFLKSANVFGKGGMINYMQEGGEDEEVSMPQSLEELMNPTRRGAANVGFGFNNEKFAGNYNYSGADNFKNGTHALNFSLPTFMKTGSLDLSGTYSPGKSYSANISGLTPANFIKKGATMNFSGGFEKDTTPMMKNVTPSYNVAAGFRIPTKVGNFTVNASYRK